MANGEAIDTTLRVIAELDRLEVDYFVVGSLASSFHGVPRSTIDVDLVADLQPRHVDPLVAALDDTFYIDRRMIQEAIRRNASFNLLHFETMFKVDIFLPKRDTLGEYEMQRRQEFAVPGHEPQKIMVASPEDVILQKLNWYQLGNQVSDRQWNDILGVLRVQHGKLDQSYLSTVAGKAGLTELLAKAMAELL